MASLFGHAYAAIAIGNNYPKKIATLKFFILGVVCSILPDADVISFSFGIPYESFWGHRGFTHSLLFAFLLGILFTVIFYNKGSISKRGLIYILFFTLCTASHSFLDAFTNGGLGVAFFSPFDNSRYFFPWRPIKVSPLSAGSFFSEWGLKVILSEMIWIGIPSTLLILVVRSFRKATISKN
jgi:inner membrane protein